MQEAATIKGDDPLSLCEIVAPLANYLEKQHDKTNCDRAKAFANEVLKATYPEPPVEETLLARYQAVAKALKPTEGAEERTDFWGKNKMRSVY